MKKLLSILLSLALALTLCCGTAARAAISYHSLTELAAAESYAITLNNLGLLKGTGENPDGSPIYTLNRPFLRSEAVTMLVRLLGKEEEAQTGSWSHPFTDVPAWADGYVGYAYQHDLTKGIGPDEQGRERFGPDLIASAHQYVTFLLRALGYTDADVATTLYGEALTMAESMGLLDSPVDYRLCLEPGLFWRSDAVVLSYQALNLQNGVKGGGSLLDRLRAEGLFTPKPAENPIGIHHAVLTIRGYGTVRLELDGNTAPVTVANFMKLAREGFYDGLTFHRIMAGFMIQGGDPNGNGTGGSGQTIQGEFSANRIVNNISHTAGVISMARSQSYNSASSQFFITVGPSTFLNGQYAAFGRVTNEEGMEVVRKIAADARPIDDNGTIPAEEQPVIESIVITD